MSGKTTAEMLRETLTPERLRELRERAWREDEVDPTTSDLIVRETEEALRRRRGP